MPHHPVTIDSPRSPTPARVRILFADDFPPFRLRVRSLLQRETDLEILCEACDGVEAVQKAAEMRPDVVILDVNMPRMNGIEAARMIRRLSPESKIIILTQDTHEDVMSAALEAGADAYVVKARMTTELIPAIRVTQRIRC